MSWKLSVSPKEKSGGRTASRGNGNSHEKKDRPVIAFYPNAQNPTARQRHRTARLKHFIKKPLFPIKKV
jgi:hypothetical protein